LFGTDGIRAVAGEYPLDHKTVIAIGRALGARLRRRVESPRVVLGQDTRESSLWIAEALAEGLAGSGAAFTSAGVITTPGVAFLVRTHGFDAGIVISASHNPWKDNGIKLFGSDGMKLADAIEHEIERDIFAHIEELANSTPKHDFTADILPGNAELRQDYVRWLASNIDAQKVAGIRLLADCAHGAASSVAGPLFESLGVKAKVINSAPNGRNINDHCGALYPQHVGELIRDSGGKFEFGVTFDGDADRALFSDAHGNVVNGDAVMFLAALDMKSRNLLPGDTVVATTMSNMGLEKALRDHGIKMLRANVGDRYVLEEMKKSGATLGGEQSGHVLFMDGDSTTGDGLLTALRVLEVVARTGKPLHELLAGFHMFPQVTKNVHVRERVPFAELPAVMDAIRAAETDLDGNGRVLVRYSGTEKLARVMIEADSAELMNRHSEAVASAIKAAIGA
jgi:phosphoglucosamine mutase